MSPAFLKFLVIGGGGFVVDAVCTTFLLQLGASPWQARPPAIFLAMLFTWLANRRFTYMVGSRRTLAEGMRYGSVALGMAVINYVLYLVLIRLGTHSLLALTIATACQVIVSFHAYRHIVFMKR